MKLPRQFTVPVVGTDPVPSSADMIATGLQAACRQHAPGYVVQFGLIPISPETPRVKKILIDWKKFKMSTVRDGDYYVIVLYNRTGAGGTYDIQTRYRTYK